MSTTTNKYLAYWREHYESRTYANKATAFDEYEPAYGYGVGSFNDVDSDLPRDWIASRVTSTLAWDRAGFAARYARDRLSSRR